MQHPDCQSVEAGTEAVFRVNATGDKLHFQWQKNHRNLCDSDRYCGIETDTLHIIEVEKRDKGRYRCIVKNDMESKPSKEALLAITSKLVIIIHMTTVVYRIGYCWPIDDIGLVCMYQYVHFKLTWWYCFVSLVPRPTPFFVLQFAFNIIHGGGRALFRLRVLY